MPRAFEAMAKTSYREARGAVVLMVGLLFRAVA